MSALWDFSVLWIGTAGTFYALLLLAYFAIRLAFRVSDAVRGFLNFWK